MGMARLAPCDNSKTKKNGYTRRFYIDLNDGHVIQKLRERAPNLAETLIHRDDYDLANWLDNMIVEAIKLGQVQYVTDNDDVEAQIVDLNETTGQPIYAMLKPENGRPKEFTQRVMTILTHEQGEHSMRCGKWKKGKGMGSLGQKLAAKLAEMPPAPLAPVVPKRVESSPPKESQPKGDMTKGITLIRYTRLETHYEEYERGSEYLKLRLAELYECEGVKDIRVFHEAKMTVKKTITVEVE